MIFAPIRAFRAAVHEASFPRAAVLLTVSQPAISAKIKGMEETYGLVLFRRDNRKVVLTEPGQRFFEISRRILRLVEEADEVLKSYKETTS